MSDLARVLIVEADENALAHFRASVELEPRCRLSVAGDAADAIRQAGQHPPDLIVISHAGTGSHGLSLCQQLKRDPALADTMVVLIVDRGAHDVRLAGLTFGVDEYLTRPLESSEILTKLHWMLRFRKVRAELRRDHAQLVELQESLRSRFTQVLALLAQMLDMRIPGAADRGALIAERALQVAGRFSVPELHLADLEMAGRLHEIGRLLSAPEEGDALLASHQTVDRWQYIMSSHAVFEKIPGLEGAAELIGAVYENWDGTGHPRRLQQGQIPLRSRILRVLIDLFTELGSADAPSMEQVVEDLQAHAGTRYDPMVLVHLRSVLEGADGASLQGSRRVLPVTDLRAGMVLAEDLFTPSGLKLLARETRLTQSTLDAILRRHSVEPIVQGAVVQRS